MKLRSAGIALLVAALSLTGCESGDNSSEATGKPVKIKFVLTGANSLYAPFWLALERGDFTTAGLDVSYQIIPETNVPAALTSNDAQLANAMPLALNLANQGKETEFIYAAVGGGAGLFAAGRPDLASLADCEEMVGMVKGGSMYAGGVILQKVYGAHYKILDRYSIASLVTAAALKGEGDCMMGSYPNLSPVIGAGKMKLLVDPRKPESLPAGFPRGMTEAALVGLKSTLDKPAMKAAIPKFLQVWDKSLREMKGMSSAAVITELRKNPDLTQQPEAQQIADFDILRGFISPSDGYISAKSWPQTMQFFVDGGIVGGSATDAKWSYGARVDMSFYEQSIGKPAAG
jgi:hypothetical protein